MHLAVLVCLLASPVLASATDPAPDETFTLGTLRVERHGQRGRPVVLVPGLASGSWVWSDTVAALRDDHVVYVVTLAGFDGVPAPAGDAPLLDAAAASLANLLDTRRLDRPIVVGHSLGGTLALRLATEHPSRLGGVVTVDGLPVFPGTELADAAGRAAMAAELRRRMEGLGPEAFQAQQRGYMAAVGLVDPVAGARAAERTARSDPRAVARYAAEVVAFDLRPALPRAAVPVLVIVPYHAPDHAVPPRVMAEDQKAAYYRSLLEGAPDVKVVAIAGARHFVMLDQPEAFRRTLASFLAGR